MGVFIFLMLVAIEISAATLCIVTRSNQLKARSIMRISTFLGFMALIALSIIDWGLRYYSVAGLLVLLAALGAINLIFKRKEKRDYKARRIILKSIGMIILVFIVTLPAIIFPQYKEIKTTGTYQVATVNYTYTDSGRVETYTNTGEKRKLMVELWYPKTAEGSYPLIVFSHGSFGVKSSNETLYNELASHGYVVCSIDHTYQCLYTADEKGNRTFLDKGFKQEVFTENASANRQQSYEYYQKWMKIRTGDINFVIDNILAEAKKNNPNEVYKLIDTRKIGVMGHSLGGSAALGIGRMREDVGAVIALESPFMCDIMGVKDGEFVFTDKLYPVPVLNLYSDAAWNLLGKRPQYVKNYALLSNTSEKAFNVYIKGAGHLTLTDLALTSPILTRILNGQKSTADTEYCLKVINKVCVEFFDCYLKGEGKFTAEGNY